MDRSTAAPIMVRMLASPHFSPPPVIALTCPGFHQRALIAALASNYKLVGLVIRDDPQAKGPIARRFARIASPRALVSHLKARRAIAAYERGAELIERSLFWTDGAEPQIPADVPRITVTDINSAEAVAFVREVAPDLIAVNGTNLLRAPMLEAAASAPLGTINLHTGLSPYSRGGNCNLFMLHEGRPELVGVTVHHIDAGIDSGDIIFTGRPELTPADTYETIEAKVFRLGIDLMIEAIRRLSEGRSERVPQWEKGKLFLRRTGYVYEPRIRVEVNQLLAQGLIADYLREREKRDAGIRVIAPAE